MNHEHCGVTDWINISPVSSPFLRVGYVYLVLIVVVCCIDLYFIILLFLLLSVKDRKGKNDKKAESSGVNIVVPLCMGKCDVVKVSMEELLDIYKEGLE